MVNLAIAMPNGFQVSGFEFGFRVSGFRFPVVVGLFASKVLAHQGAVIGKFDASKRHNKNALKLAEKSDAKPET